MRKTLVIAWKEYKSFFTGLTAYVAGGFMVAMVSWMFANILFAFAQRSFMMALQSQGKGMNLTEFVFPPHFGNTNVLMIFFVPPLMMRLMSEEYRSRTIDLLMTSPVTAAQIVMGKFLAGLFFVWTVLAVLAIHIPILSTLAQYDKGPILTGYIGLFLMSGVYVAICLFASSLTENPVIAVGLGWGFCLMLWVVSWASGNVDNPTTQNVLNNMSVVTHFTEFTKGVINTQGVVYFLSLIFFFCFLSHRVIESARWR